MIHFVLPAAREGTVHEYVAVWGRGVADRLRVLHYETLPARSRLARGTYVLSALDQLGPATLRLLVEVRRQLDEAGGVRVLNDPARTLRRFELLAELRRRGHNEFGAAHVTSDLSGLRYPVFLREERGHGGALTPLLRSAAEVEAALGRALVRGHRVDDLLVVEFCDTADAEGYYRKYAAFVVGDQVIPRSLAYGRSWMLKHQAVEFSRAMVEEEREYVLTNPHERELAEIFRLARVEYGRIDYAVQGGGERVQTWEINLHPTIGRGTRPPSGKVPPELEPVRRETKEHFYRRFQAAWEAVDVPSDGAPEVAVAMDARTVQAALSEHAHREGESAGPLATLRGALRPVKPLVEPLASRVLPLLGRLARRAGARRR